MNKEIEKLKEEKCRNEAKIRQVSHEIKALEAEEKSLLRKQRNHRHEADFLSRQCYLANLFLRRKACRLHRIVRVLKPVEQREQHLRDRGRAEQNTHGEICRYGGRVSRK